MRVIVRKSVVAAAPGVAEAGYTHQARDDAAVDMVIIGDHRAIAGERSAYAGIGGWQRIGGARDGRQAAVENEILMHDLDRVSGRNDVVVVAVDHAQRERKRTRRSLLARLQRDRI